MIEDAGDDVQAKVQALIDEYNAVGHVPYKDKDKVYKEYHDVLDKVYDTLHSKQTRRRLDNFKNNLKNVVRRGDDAVDNERARLMPVWPALIRMLLPPLTPCWPRTAFLFMCQKA